MGSPCQGLARSRANILAGSAGGHQLPNILSKDQSLKGPRAQCVLGSYLHPLSTLHQNAPSHHK